MFQKAVLSRGNQNSGNNHNYCIHFLNWERPEGFEIFNRCPWNCVAVNVFVVSSKKCDRETYFYNPRYISMCHLEGALDGPFLSCLDGILVHGRKLYRRPDSNVCQIQHCGQK